MDDKWSGWDVWICYLAAILLMDPVAILSQSLWLSAAAVAALIFWYQWFPCPEWQLPPVLRAVVSLIHLQLGITLLLMPVQIVIFHGISLTSFIANLFAIPLVTFITVPLILAAMVVHLSGPFILEQGLWFLADRSLALLFWGLKSLPEGGSTLLNVGNGFNIFPMVLTGGMAIKRLANVASNVCGCRLADVLAAVAKTST